jgi:D-alanyl-D-alanine carboxypeptidase
MATTEADNILNSLVGRNKTPSVQYAYFTKDAIIHSYKAGLADILNKNEVTAATTCNIYSITKTFTALAVLQLAERKLIDIEKPVKNYLRQFPYSSQITIKQLLSHSAGIPNPIPLSWIHLANENKSFDRNAFFKQIFHTHPRTKNKPNEKFAYSNLGYVLLGQLIENVSGLRYEEYVQKNILTPLHIHSNEMGFTIADTTLQAKGYHKKKSFSYFLLGFFLNKQKFIDRTESKWKSFRYNYVNGASYGGLIGTTNALIKYVQELLKTDSVLISDTYRKMLFTENYTTDNKPTGMCLSWFKGEMNGHTYYTHAGGGGGYYCEIRLYPEKETGSVLMFNRTGMTDERFLSKLDRYFIDENSDDSISKE